MKSTLFIMAFVLVGAPLFADTECTKEPQDKWKNQIEFQKNLQEQGYKIKKFKVTDGNCYEIYGWNKEGDRVEIYFNPVDGSIIKQEKD